MHQIQMKRFSFLRFAIITNRDIYLDGCKVGVRCRSEGHWGSQLNLVGQTPFQLGLDNLSLRDGIVLLAFNQNIFSKL